MNSQKQPGQRSKYKKMKLFKPKYSKYNQFYVGERLNDAEKLAY